MAFIRYMKPHTAYERALKTIVRFEREIAGTISVSGQVFGEAISHAFMHYADEDAYFVMQKQKDAIQKIAIIPDHTTSICASEELSAWNDVLKRNRFTSTKDNDGSLISKKYHAWMLIPVSVKGEIVIAIVIARQRGHFHHEELKAGEELGDYFTQSLRNIRAKNRKTITIADEARHGALLHTQSNLCQCKTEWKGLSRAIDYSARTGSDIGKSWRNGDQSVLVCACDITADDAERQEGLIYLDTWFSIFSQTSLDAKGMLQRLNSDMVKRAAECYASVAIVRYTKKTCKAEIAGCGNACVAYFSHDSMDARSILFGPAAGVGGDTEIRSQEIQIKQGDIICAFTDGISGTRKKNGALFGEDAVCEIVKKNYFLSAEDLAAKILSVLKEKEEKGINADDRTLEVLKIE